MVESRLHSCLVRLYEGRELSVNDTVIANFCSEPLDALDRRIQPLLADGELLPLRMPAGQTREVRLSLVSKDLSSNSRELNALADLLGANYGVAAI